MLGKIWDTDYNVAATSFFEDVHTNKQKNQLQHKTPKPLETTIIALIVLYGGFYGPQLSLSQAMLCSQELLINYSRGNIVIMVRDDGKSRCETNNDNCDGNKAYDGFSCTEKGF